MAAWAAAAAKATSTNRAAAIERMVRMVGSLRGGQSHFSSRTQKNWDSPRRLSLQCKRPCSAARAKRAVRGGCGPVSGVWRLGLTGPFCFGQLLVVSRWWSFEIDLAFILHAFINCLRFDHCFRLIAQQFERETTAPKGRRSLDFLVDGRFCFCE